jgi:hypothetical protein
VASHPGRSVRVRGIVDDEQWLDRASPQALAFVARRLEAESVGLVFAARGASDDLAALPQLVVEGPADEDARALLDSVLTGPLDARVRDQIVSETRGNPHRALMNNIELYGTQVIPRVRKLLA